MGELDNNASTAIVTEHHFQASANREDQAPGETFAALHPLTCSSPVSENTSTDMAVRPEGYAYRGHDHCESASKVSTRQRGGDLRCRGVLLFELC